MSAAAMTPLIGLATCSLAAAFIVLTPSRVVSLGDPQVSDREDIVDVASVNVPEIRPFAHYFGDKKDNWRNLNPFLPFAERMKERDHRNRRDTAPKKGGPLPQPPPKEWKEAVEVIDPPKLVVPSLTGSVMVPRVVGLIAAGGTSMLKVSMGADLSRNLTVGEDIAGWKWTGIEAERAVFSDPDGAEHRLVIGTADNPMTVIEGDAGGPSDARSKSDKKDKKDKKDKGPIARRDTHGRSNGNGGTNHRRNGDDGEKKDRQGMTADERARLRRAMANPLVKKYLSQNPGMRKQIALNPKEALRIIESYVGKQ